MSDRREKPDDEIIEEARIARDEAHAGDVEGEWEDFMDGDADEELL